ncbi:GntR family transcriptional regulator [Trueperella pyogenes]|uniref:FadR/GntR family transcriptional regulator n=1 Tax=Trueperella pyogenes TaxID=1661 RepID=UPI000C1B6D43|nr:FCD domain-containing protein [Trueperella pyogenes]PIN51249.1 GntR family transcriptional regulator [Trueperella pyogenes]
MTNSRFEDIVHVLGPRIANGELSPGKAITLADIEEEFECSRTVAREVQRSLEECGFVVPQRRRGLVVQNLARWDVLNPRVIRWRLSGPQGDRQMRSLIDLREAIEPMAAELAAQFAPRDLRDELLNLAAELTRLGSVASSAEFMDADVRFHTLILEASGNEMFVSLGSTIEAMLKWRAENMLMPPRPEPRALRDHEAIARAIYTGDAITAREAMRDIVVEVRTAFNSRMPNVLRFD